MNYILYNPLSKKGKSFKSLAKLEKLLEVKKWEYKTLNLIELEVKIEAFLTSLDEKDKVIIVGGDGTLHYIFNAIKDYTIKNDIYLYKAGTGNDFSREFKGDLILLNQYLTNLPYYTIDGQKTLFLNCSGVGIDGEVCLDVSKGSKPKSGFHYYLTAFKAFFKFKQFDLQLEVDGLEYYFNKVYFATVMNGKYFGGGMKLAPNSIRNDEKLEIYIIHRIKLWRLLLVFPTIFFGKHMAFKKHGIVNLSGQEIKYNISEPKTLEADGEVVENVSKVEFFYRYIKSGDIK